MTITATKSVYHTDLYNMKHTVIHIYWWDTNYWIEGHCDGVGRGKRWRLLQLHLHIIFLLLMLRLMCTHNFLEVSFQWLNYIKICHFKTSSPVMRHLSELETSQKCHPKRHTVLAENLMSEHQFTTLRATHLTQVKILPNRQLLACQYYANTQPNITRSQHPPVSWMTS